MTSFTPIGVEAQVKGFSSFMSDLGKMNKSITSVGKVMVGAAAGGVAALGGALVALGTAAVREGSAYTKEMSNVSALTGATAVEFDKLAASAENLGATTKFTATEAAEGMSFLAMAGFEVNEIIGAMPAVLNLAAAGNLDLATSADIASNILTGFNLDVSQSNRVMDILAATMTTANTDLVQLGAGMKFVAPVAATLNQDIEDVAAAMGKLADAGIQGEMGGTALRAGLLRLAAPTGKAEKLIKKLGLEMFDLDGNMIPLPKVIGQIADATKGMGQQQKAATLQTIFGLRNVAAFNVLLSEGEKELQDYGNELRDSAGTAARIAAEQLNNLAGDVTLLQSAFSGVKIGIFKTLEPILRGNAQASKALLETFGPVLIDIFDTFVQAVIILKAEFAGLGGEFSFADLAVQAISASLEFFNTTIMPALIATIQFVNTHWETFKGAIMGIMVVLGGAGLAAIISFVVTALGTILSPIGLLIAAAAALGAAWNTNFLGIRDIVLNVWENTIKPTFFAIVEWLQTNIPVAIQALSAFWETTLIPAMNTVKEFVTNSFIPILTELQKWLKDELPKAIEALQGVWESKLLPAIKAVEGFLKDELIPRLMILKDIYVEHFSEFLPLLWEAFQELVAVWNDEVQPALDDLFVALGELAVELGIADIATGNLDGAMGLLDIILLAIKLTLEAVIFAVEAMILVIEPLGIALSTVIGFVTDGLQDMKDFASAIKGLADNTRDWKDRIEELLIALANLVLPDWLVPGSPTPLEIGLKGINRQMIGTIAGTQALGMSLSGISGGGSSVVNNNINISIANTSGDFASDAQMAQSVRMNMARALT